MDRGVRPGRIAAVFGAGLALLMGLLWLWWPAGVAAGIVLATLTTWVIGRRLQDQAEEVPDDLELLESLDVSSGSGRVTRTVLAPAPRGASIR